MEKKELLELYHQMVLIRRVEESAAELYQQGKIGGFLHLIYWSGSGQHRVDLGPQTSGSGDHCLPGPRGGDQLRYSRPAGDG